MKNLAFLIILCCIYSNTTFSQNYVDILKITTSTTPENKFDSSNTSTKIKEQGVEVTYPIKISDKNKIVTGLIYERINAKLFEKNTETTVTGIALKIGLNRTFNDKWSGNFILLPKLSSDFKNIGSNDFQIGGVGIIKFKKNDNFLYKFGAYINGDLFGALITPMFGFYYTSPNKKFESNLMLPLQADINYQLIKLITIGVNLNGQQRSYHLTDITPQFANTYLGKTTKELYGYLKFNLSKSISLHARVGKSFGRWYRVYNTNDKVSFALPGKFFGDDRTQLNSDFSDGLIYQLTFLYRFNL